MSTQDDGGPAFPRPDAQAGDCRGMSLRDYFAAKALIAISTTEYAIGMSQAATQRGVPLHTAAAQVAYEWADAMLLARSA